MSHPVLRLAPVKPGVLCAGDHRFWKALAGAGGRKRAFLANLCARAELLTLLGLWESTKGQMH